MKGTIGRPAGVAILLAGINMPAAAMVPPVLRSIGELQSVVNLPNLATALGLPIDRIERVAPGLYRITAGRCHMDVRMVEVRGPYPGRGLTAPRMEPQAGPRICER